MKNNQNYFVGVIVAIVIVVAVIFGLVVGIIKFVDWNNAHQKQRGRGDASVGKVDDSSRDVYQMPDAFSNIAMVCDSHGNAIYVTTKSDYSRGIFALKDGCEK